ncbi:MAG: HAD family phosphatase [Candidatus Enterosoma sp.]|nr:HAD family phosphatase [Candidatus Enterosoma sp.]
MNGKELFKGIKACIFDLDGTLVDSLGIWAEVDKKFFLVHNREIPEDYEKKIAHMNFRDIAIMTKEDYGFEESIEEIMKMWTDWSIDAYRNEIKAKPGVKEFLSYIHSLSIPIALATANRKELYEPCLKNNDLYEYFSYFMNVNDINSTKSEPKIYLELAKIMNAKPEETLVFEDILVAIKTAHDAGFKAVAVYDKSSKNDMDDILKSADFFVSSYNEVLEEN